MPTTENKPSSVIEGGHCLAAAGLVDAFGNVSARVEGESAAFITPARPLADVSQVGELLELPLDEQTVLLSGGAGDIASRDAMEAPLPAGVPKEGWIHWAIYRRRPDVLAICRATPPTILGLSVTTTSLAPLHGQGALVGVSVPIFDDARLVRDPARGEQVADALGQHAAIVLRGNGAVTTGRTVGEAVARMVLLERSAQIIQAASAHEARVPLSPEEARAWNELAPELLPRFWEWLRTRYAGQPG